MRLRVLLFAMVFAGSAHAATIDGNRGVACNDKADAAKIRSMAAGDQKRWADEAQRLIGAGECHMLMHGESVRVDERDNAAGIVRVAPAGSKGYAGAWIDARSV